MTSYDDVIVDLRNAYAKSARERNNTEKGDWKRSERVLFSERLREEGKHRLLEVGAGTGQDSVFFRDNGLEVVATDLTPEMVEFCLEKGLDARVMDCMNLGFPDSSFDAVWSMNCLLHVPNADMPAVLRSIATLLRPGGLFFVGVYGGDEGSGEGVNTDDWHDPPRFFSWRTDDELDAFARECFEVVDFHTIGEGRARFQALTLRKPA